MRERTRVRTWTLIISGALTAATLSLACDAEVEKLDDKTRSNDLASPDEGITPYNADRPGSLMEGYLASGGVEDLVFAGEYGRYLFERNTLKDRQEAVKGDAWLRPGALIDAVGTEGGDDGLIALTNAVVIGNSGLRLIEYKDIGVANGANGGWMSATGTVNVDGANLSVSTRAVLARDLPHIILKTRYRNESAKALLVRPADRLNFAPGAIFSAQGAQTRPGRTKTAWLGYEAIPSAYGYTIDGKTGFDATFHISDRGDRFTTTGVDAVAQPTRLEPGAEMTYVRRFRASGKGLLSIRAWLASLNGGQIGRVGGKVEASRELDVNGFRFAVKRGDTLMGHIPVESGPAYESDMPAGEYTLIPKGPWGLTAPPLKLSVKRGGDVRNNISFPPLQKVKLRVREGRRPSPATVVVRSEDGKPVYLGHTGSGPANGPYVVLPLGEGEIMLPPGKYKLTATRGPEYNVDRKLIVVEEDVDVSFEASLTRRLDSKGYILADLRTYSRSDVIGTAKLEDVATALAAAGVEYGAVTNRMAPTFLTDGTRAVGLSSVLTGVPGMESSPIDPGFGAFTVLPAGNPGAGRMSAPLSGTNPDVHLKYLRRLGSGSPFVSVVWPRTPSKSGYFDIYNLDRDTGLFTRSGGTYDFDGVELLAGGGIDGNCVLRDVEKCGGPGQPVAEAVDNAARDWAALVSQGYRFTATGSSGSAWLGIDPIGIPFTWIEVGRGKDDPAKLDPRLAIDSLREGRAIASTGPLIQFTLDGKGYGSLVPGLKRIERKGKTIIIRGVKARIQVTAVDWIGFDEVVLYENGIPVEAWEVEPGSKNGVQSFSISASPKPLKDSWYHVRAFGKRPIETLPTKRILPIAVSNPIWVDGNGDGKWEAEPPEMELEE